MKAERQDTVNTSADQKTYRFNQNKHFSMELEGLSDYADKEVCKTLP
jgi:hypothetical protein